MDCPKVSIVVPAYNIEKYISKCLHSLLNQKYSNIEVIVVDDGSTDETWKVLQKYQNRDKRVYTIRQENGRTAKARNKALDYVTGDFLLFVDGDDYLSETTISDIIPFFRDDCDLDWVSFPILRVDERGNLIEQSKTYNGFAPPRNEYVFREQFLDYYSEYKLSGLCCGTMYRWEAVKNMRFPVGEYYEDNFYFLESLWTTNKALLTNIGQYYYVERSGSSQFARMDKAHLLSTLHCESYGLKGLRRHFPQKAKIINKLEDVSYYYFKSFYAKGYSGADEIFQEFCFTFNVPHNKNYKYELFCLLHKVVRIFKYLKFRKWNSVNIRS